MASNGDLYVGSIAGGTIFKIESGSQKAEVFVEAGVIQNATGLHVADDVLWACEVSMTTGFDRSPEIVGFALNSGDVVARHPFPASTEVALRTICNDLDMDGEGNLYATSSYSHEVMRVAADDLSTDGVEAEVWTDDALFGANITAEAPLGLNGIAYVGDQSLYVVSYGTGELFQISIAADGSANTVTLIDLVALDATGQSTPRTLAAPDGIERLDENTLLVVEQGNNWLSSIDLETEVVTPVAGGLDNPSTFVLDADGNAWVVNSQLNDLLAGQAPTLPFHISLVPLSE